jgi:glycosyltransferase involved in cell wall biosynthesis
MSKIFCTLFTDLQNIHLIKDPGMIPLTFQNEYEYKSIVPIFGERQYPYKNVYFKDVEMPIIYGEKTQFTRDIARVRWLVKNAKKIDVLNLFFFYKGTWFLMWLYKKLNHKGLIYIHVDTDGERLINFEFSRNPVKNFISKRIFLNDSVIEDTLWGVQNYKNVQKLKNVWPFINIEYIPNGVFLDDNSVNFQQKENIILTVGRLGTDQKRTELLLEAFSKVYPLNPSWKLRLVGTIEPEFKKYIKHFFDENPELKENIEFVGPIYDRYLLAKEYSRAKVFCLPSAWESFGIVSIEALSKGCFLLESDIESNVEITQNGKMGMLFKSGDLEDLIDKMNITLKNEKKIEENFYNAVDYAKNHYTWGKVLKPVEMWIEKKWSNEK